MQLGPLPSSHQVQRGDKICPFDQKLPSMAGKPMSMMMNSMPKMMMAYCKRRWVEALSAPQGASVEWNLARATALTQFSSSRSSSSPLAAFLTQYYLFELIYLYWIHINSILSNHNNFVFTLNISSAMQKKYFDESLKWKKAKDCTAHL